MSAEFPWRKKLNDLTARAFSTEIFEPVSYYPDGSDLQAMYGEIRYRSGYDSSAECHVDAFEFKGTIIDTNGVAEEDEHMLGVVWDDGDEQSYSLRHGWLETSGDLANFQGEFGTIAATLRAEKLLEALKAVMPDS